MIYEFLEGSRNLPSRLGISAAWIALTISDGNFSRIENRSQWCGLQLIPFKAIDAVAATCHEGAEKYSAYNWERGLPVHSLLNHAIRHLYLELQKTDVPSEPHLAHALWNVMAARHSEVLWPELNEGTLRIEGCKPPVQEQSDAD